MDSIDDLEYRGEGNCAIVFANPKTRQVYRLVKKDYTKISRKKLKTSDHADDEIISQTKNVESDVRSKLEDTVSYITNIMEPLLSFNYAVIPELISVPKGFGEEAVKKIEDSRPAHRKRSWRNEVDPDIYSALVLSDCCFVRSSSSSKLFENVVVRPTSCPCLISVASTEDLMILTQESSSPCLVEYRNTHIYPASFKNVTVRNGIPSSTPKENGDTLCFDRIFMNGVHSYTPDFCVPGNRCEVYKKALSDLQIHNEDGNGKINPTSIMDQESSINDSSTPKTATTRQFCPLHSSSNQISLDLSHQLCHHESLSDSRMADSPVTNTKKSPTPNYTTTSTTTPVSFLPNGPSCETPTPFTLSFEIKPKKAFRVIIPDENTVDSVCRFCKHKYLKNKCGKWPDFSSYCPLDLFSGDKKRMKHALHSLIKTPQNNLKICKNGSEVYGSDIRQDLPTILRSWFPDCKEDKKRLTSSFINLIIEVLLRVPKGDITPLAKEVSSRCRRFLDSTLQTCSSSTYVHSDKGCDQGLPVGCVLERIQSIQALDTVDIDGIFPLYARIKQRVQEQPALRNKWCLDGPYTDISCLGLGEDEVDSLPPESDEYAVLKLKQFLVSKTVQDCSIIAAIQPLNSTIGGHQTTSDEEEDSDVLWFEGHPYQFSISLVDLEPKNFDKVITYFKQASQIADSFAESSFIMEQKEGGGI